MKEVWKEGVSLKGVKRVESLVIRVWSEVEVRYDFDRSGSSGH